MLRKVVTLLRCVKNWYLVPFDKLLGGMEVTYRFRSGVNVRCRTKSTDINEAVVVLSGLEYPSALVKQKSVSAPVVFDLGGNIGAFALFYDQLNRGADYQGYIFEPHPENSQLLSTNLSLNEIGRWVVIEKAVAARNGTMRLDISGGFDAFKLDGNSKNAIDVETIRLSDFCASKGINKIDLLKMDIEGGEYDILDEDLLFFESCVDLIPLEYHNLDSYRNEDFVLNRLSRTFDIKVEHCHAGGGIISATRMKQAK